MCCLFGVIDYTHKLTQKQIEKVIAALSISSEVRGKDATGIAYNSSGRLHVYKRPLPAHQIHFHLQREAHTIMGHTRMTTQGDERMNRNNHPFRGHTVDGEFALAHNGMLHNDILLRKTEKLATTKIQTDSYVAVQLIEKMGTLSFNSIRYMAEHVMGSFAFTIMDENDNMYFVKGDNPVYIYHYERLGIYLYASTEAILQASLKRIPFKLGKYNKIELECGDILRIDRLGKRTIEHFAFSEMYDRWYFPEMPAHHMEYQNTAYLNDLKLVASCYGYPPEYIDYMLRDGFTYDEIEEMLYTFDTGI